MTAFIAAAVLMALAAAGAVFAGLRRGRRSPVLLAVPAALPVAAALLYLAFGNPASLQRPAQPASRADLEAHLRAAPNDARAWVLLARLRMDDDRFDAAAAAYARAIDVSPRSVAIDAQVWAEYADALAMSQRGMLSGRPREAIDKALALDPRHPKALELAGSAALESRDYAAAHAYWSALLAQIPADSPQRPPLRAAVRKVETMARMLPAAN